MSTNSGEVQIVATASTEFEPGERVKRTFLELAELKVPSGVDSEDLDSWVVHLSPSGQLLPHRILSTSILPPPTRAFVDQIRTELSGAIKHVFRIIRWRQSLPGGHDPFMSRLDGATWSVDGIAWHILPGRMDVRVSQPTSISLASHAIDEIQLLLDSGEREPVAHELLREARELAPRSARSALLMAVTALEAGTKQLVSKLNPRSQWLMENTPSPNVVLMFEQYVPILVDEHRRAFALLPKELVTALKAGIHARNTLTHTGVMRMSRPSVEQYVETVFQVLRRLDYLRGYDWAAAPE